MHMDSTQIVIFKRNNVRENDGFLRGKWGGSGVQRTKKTMWHWQTYSHKRITTTTTTTPILSKTGEQERKQILHRINLCRLVTGIDKILKPTHVSLSVLIVFLLFACYRFKCVRVFFILVESKCKFSFASNFKKCVLLKKKPLFFRTLEKYWNLPCHSIRYSA